MGKSTHVTCLGLHLRCIESMQSSSINARSQHMTRATLAPNDLTNLLMIGSPLTQGAFSLPVRWSHQSCASQPRLLALPASWLLASQPTPQPIRIVASKAAIFPCKSHASQPTGPRLCTDLRSGGQERSHPRNRRSTRQHGKSTVLPPVAIHPTYLGLGGYLPALHARTRDQNAQGPESKMLPGGQ